MSTALRRGGRGIMNECRYARGIEVFRIGHQAGEQPTLGFYRRAKPESGDGWVRGKLTVRFTEDRRKLVGVAATANGSISAQELLDRGFTVGVESSPEIEKHRPEAQCAIISHWPNPLVLRQVWTRVTVLATFARMLRRVDAAGPNSLSADGLMVEPQVIVAAVGTVGVVVMILVRMTYKHKEKMASLTSNPSTNPALDSRLGRIEDVVETIAIEIERMGEGQRFVTKLLAERTAAEQSRERLSAASPRITTPH